MFVTFLLIGVASIVQICTDPRITPAFIWGSIGALALYAAHSAAGFAALAYLVPWEPDRAPGLTAALVGWLFLGGVVLVRTAPRLRQPPAILLRFGILDVICLAMVSVGFLSAFGVL